MRSACSVLEPARRRVRRTSSWRRASRPTAHPTTDPRCGPARCRCGRARARRPTVAPDRSSRRTRAPASAAANASTAAVVSYPPPDPTVTMTDRSVTRFANVTRAPARRTRSRACRVLGTDRRGEQLRQGIGGAVATRRGARSVRAGGPCALPNAAASASGPRRPHQLQSFDFREHAVHDDRAEFHTRRCPPTRTPCRSIRSPAFLPRASQHHLAARRVGKQFEHVARLVLDRPHPTVSSRLRAARRT